ncbi:MAG: lipid A biosynthesis acyltransferase, partial [Woeseiaceae bacterium]|nr:lipid A biosynthesis acyltransferase [Woeseiaceae bacterium]
MSSDRKPLSSYWSPRYWPIWIGLGLLRLVCLLPHKLGLGLGRIIGRLAYLVAGSRRFIVLRNLELCFPEMTDAERKRLAKRHFEALGMSIIEMGLGRWASDRFHDRISTLEGREHLDAAVADGKGIILLSAHFTTLEIMGRKLAMVSPPFDAVYRRNRSDFITELMRSGREKSADDSIEKRDIKRMVRSLRDGRP